jgi:hypothetical protein
MTLSHTPRVRRRHARSGPPVGRLRDAARLLGRGRSGRGGRRARGAGRPQPARSQAKRQRRGASSSRTRIAPRRAWAARAARATEPEARAAGAGGRWPGGREARRLFFTPRGHFPARGGPELHGRRRSPVRDHARGQEGRRAPGGRAHRGASGAGPAHRGVGAVAQSAGAPARPGAPPAHSAAPTCGGRHGPHGTPRRRR